MNFSHLKLDLKMGLAVAGGVLSIIGCMLPVVSVFGIASVKFFSEGRDGILIAVLVVISVLLVVFNKWRFLTLTGVLCLGIIVINYLDITGNEFADLFSIEWSGWVVMTLGAAGMIASGVVAFMERRQGAALAQAA